MSQPYKYFAFISYSRKDSEAAAWLQRKLEWLRFPVKLVTHTHRPLHPKYLRPIYRDKISLDVDHQDYWENIKRDLDQSRYLIVLCSPHSASSGPVDKEVRHFLANHESGIESMIPVILRGSVTDQGSDGCLCPALRELGHQITSRNLPSMVPDAGSGETEGWENGFVGTAAYLLGVQRNALSDHLRREERRNLAKRWAIGAVVAVLVSLTTMQYLRIRDVGIEKMNTEEARARLQLQKGKDLCNGGDPGRGILWLNESLKKCPPSAPALHEIIRMEMGAASLMLHELDQIFSIPGAFVVTGFAPNGSPLVLTATGHQLSHVMTGEPHGQYLPNPDQISIRALNSEGTMFATSSLSDGLVVLSSLVDGTPVGPQIQHNGAIRGMAFHPRSSHLLIAAFPRANAPFVPLQSYATGKDGSGLIFDCHEKLNGAAYSKDGRLVVAASQEGNALIFDAETGMPFGTPMKHPGPVFCASFSPDGQRIVTGCLDGVVRVWRLSKDGTTSIDPAFVAKHTRAVRGVSFSNSGRLVLSGSEDGTARLWESHSGQPFGQPMPDSVEVRYVHFSPDDKYVLAGGWKKSARLWKLARENALARTLRQYGAVETVAFSPDGKLAVTGCQGSLDHVGIAQMWDAQTGEKHGPELLQGGQVKSVAFSSDGKRVATAGNNGSVKIWNTSDGSLIGEPWIYGDVVAAVAFSHDNRWMAMSGRGNKVMLVDLSASRLVHSWQAFPESGMYAYDLTFSKDNRSLLVGGSFSGRIFSIPDGQQKTAMIHASNGQSAEVRRAILSPDEKVLVTAGINKEALLWSADSGTRLHNDPLHHDGFVLDGAFTPDSKTLATSSADGTVKVWDVATGKKRYPELTHNGWVLSVAFSNDGKVLASGCDDGVARLWRTSDGSPIGAELYHGGPVTKIVFNPTSNTILTASQDGTARLWSPPPPILGPLSDVEDQVESKTGLKLLENHTIQILTKEEWFKHRTSIQKQ